MISQLVGILKTSPIEKPETLRHQQSLSLPKMMLSLIDECFLQSPSKIVSSHSSILVSIRCVFSRTNKYFLSLPNRLGSIETSLVTHVYDSHPPCPTGRVYTRTFPHHMCVHFTTITTNCLNYLLAHTKI